MSQELVYQWMAEIARHWPEWGRWQVKGLALFSLGVVVAERSSLPKVAEKLGAWGYADSLERRFQRWISNPRLEVQVCLRGWVRWVVKVVHQERLVLLVDETHLGSRLSILMVGVAYRQRCIPLVWQCYAKQVGQVERIKALLTLVAEVGGLSQPPLVEADRGIGTSPALIGVVRDLGWHYLFRVQNHTKVLTRHDHAVALQRLVQRPGQVWFGHGLVFKQRGRVLAYVQVAWALGQAEPWCLVTNDPLVGAHRYALRVWEEESFRDLKSGGWQWQRSRVWQPEHAERLLLVLALAYAWVLTYGTLVLDNPAWLCRVTRGTQRRLSIFRCGLRFLNQCFARNQPLYIGLRFCPSIPACPKLS